MDIALNVGRSRLTILSITLALFLFATSVFLDIGEQMEIRATWVFLTSFVAIVLGFSLTVLSLLLFLISQRLDSAGNCEIWTFSCGELLMYVALAQTLSGGLGTYVSAIANTLAGVPGALALGPEATGAFGKAASNLSGLLRLGTGLVWGIILYVAPVVFLLRVNLARSKRGWLAVGYVALLLSVFWISAFPYHLKARASGKPSNLGVHFTRQFCQPLLWQIDPSALSKRTIVRDP